MAYFDPKNLLSGPSGVTQTRTQGEVVYLRGNLHPLKLHEGVNRSEAVVGLRPYRLGRRLGQAAFDFNDL
jgi:hypothetical protein